MLRTVLSALSVAVVMGLGVAQAAEIEIGAQGPAFKAQGTDGKDYTLPEDAEVTVVCFTCNRCPVSVAYEDRFIEFTKKYGDKKVAFIAINCNASENLEAMKERVEEKGINYVYALDESGNSARGYGARVTPHVFVLDKEGKVAYRGAFDDDMKNPTKHYVTDAVDALLDGKTPEVTSSKAFGCGISLKKKAE